MNFSPLSHLSPFFPIWGGNQIFHGFPVLIFQLCFSSFPGITSKSSPKPNLCCRTPQHQWGAQSSPGLVCFHLTLPFLGAEVPPGEGKFRLDLGLSLIHI